MGRDGLTSRRADLYLDWIVSDHENYHPCESRSHADEGGMSTACDSRAYFSVTATNTAYANFPLKLTRSSPVRLIGCHRPIAWRASLLTRVDQCNDLGVLCTLAFT
jgi:hypothetical protein